jgi:queuine tRNA-ribosyltransferase
MPSPISFKIEKRLKGKLGRAGRLLTGRGEITTPAFVIVGTKATVKSLLPEQVKELGGQVILGNTYHLFLEPGDKLLKEAGGLGAFMNWLGPTMTDSGGFQVFSLGQGYGRRETKIRNADGPHSSRKEYEEGPAVSLARVDEEGVTFKSESDGGTHRFTPERSIEIQHNIGADIIFAFDECTSPRASYEYQKESVERTKRWAERSLQRHRELSGGDCEPRTRPSALFGIVQGGRFQDLREQSARALSKLEFEGFGIGGSFEKKDIDTAVGWVNRILPEEKPRHLLGIGHPLDLFGAVENGCDLFDCVAPTRLARNGSLYSRRGNINILNARFKQDFGRIEENCACYTCRSYTRAYLAHLFRANEILANTLASIHNLYFIVHLVKEMRQAILNREFFKLKENFFQQYKK